MWALRPIWVFFLCWQFRRRKLSFRNNRTFWNAGLIVYDAGVVKLAMDKLLAKQVQRANE
jgi:hypothetical protein